MGFFQFLVIFLLIIIAIYLYFTLKILGLLVSYVEKIERNSNK